VLQVINFTTGAVASGTTTIPIDDTIPQNTEGNEYMSLAFTPVSATSNLKIDIVAQVWNNTSSAMSAALFQDSITSAIGAVFRGALPSSGEPLTFTVYVASASTSTRTYKVRVGSNAASTTTFNGTLGNRMFGGVMASSITIMEIAA
jgi:hypothetical protein